MQRQRQTEKARRLTRLYSALSEINQAIVRMEQESQLFPLVCRCSVEFGGMSMAWVGIPHEQNHLFSPVARYGDKQGYLDNVRAASSADVPEGHGPAGTAFRENRIVIINDYQADTSLSPWKRPSRQPDWNSEAAFPIARGGQPYAVLNVFHSSINAFDAEAIALLEEMSKDVSFSLDNFDRMVRQKSAEDSLRLAASVYQNSGEGMMITDADNRIMAVNPAFTKITGFTPAEAVGQSPSLLKSGHHDEVFYRAMWKSINETGSWQGEIWDRRKGGEIYPKWLSINSVFAEEGRLLHRIALFTDISQQKEFEELIWRQANFDTLTDLPNRRMFYDRLEQQIKKSHRSEQPLALLFLDIDHFKDVNDNLGHAKGDILLTEAARRLVDCVRETDTVARFGGDEFTIILGELGDLDRVDYLCQEVLSRLAAPFQLGEDLAYVSASIGVTFYPSDATDTDRLLKNADQAMYAAKNTGRNRYSYFTPSMQALSQSRMRMAIDLRTALESRQFSLAYQPIVDLKTGVVRKAESLARWFVPGQGLVSPGEFIPVAEHTGIIVDIGDFVFRQAAEQTQHWRKSIHPDFQLSVNMSPVQFKNNSNHSAGWLSHLESLGLPGSSIVIEITEGLLMDSNDAGIEQLLVFRDQGIKVALDDFGTGYSSLSYLKKFDIDFIKIDQSFVHNLGADVSSQALCEAMIMMAHKLGLAVIAEGVETEEQLAFLRASGCDYAQGYYFSKPLTAEAFESRFPASTHFDLAKV
ncbi:MAG: EAL domain-containing protein [Betaproteobacteria bacterium]|nr:EAL domain-containing protein [Betaproteobacteria bacterium]